jgi:hypothetical protein
MSEEDVGPNAADDLANRSARFDAGVELAIHDAKEGDLSSTDQPRGFELFLFADSYQLGCVDRRIPSPLRSVSENQVMNSTTRR